MFNKSNTSFCFFQFSQTQGVPEKGLVQEAVNPKPADPKASLEK